MSLREEIVDAILQRYLNSGKTVLSFGTGELSEKFIKKIAFKVENEGLDIKVIPTSAHIAGILSELNIPTTTLNESEIDLAIEFVDLVDRHFNFIKRDSLSLVRDKMIAQSAEELIVIAGEKDYVKKLDGIVPFEITSFGWKRTLTQLEKFGEATLRMQGAAPFRTETNNYMTDVFIDEIFSLDEIETQTKNVPGVIETGLFIGYADRILLHNGKIQVKSRMDYSRQNTIETPELRSPFTI